MGSSALILEGGSLIDGSGGVPIADALVVIEGDRITYAGARSNQFDDYPAERLRLDGKTIVPGLIDAHTHAISDADLSAYLKNGITTVRFAGLDPVAVANLRRRIREGDVESPHILSCGPMIDEPPVAYPQWSHAVSSPDVATQVTLRIINEYEPDALIVTQRVTAPVMKAVIDVAHDHGLRVLGQIWAVDAAEAARLGIDELHASSRVFRSRLYPPERLLAYASISDRLALTSRAWASVDWDLTQPIMEAMIGRNITYCGMHVVTQFLAGEGIEALEGDADFRSMFGAHDQQTFKAFTQRLQGTWTREDFDYARRGNDNRVAWMQRYREMGGVLIAGTDIYFGGILYHRELHNLEGLGLSRLEVITTATGGCAKAFGLDHSFGFIRQGRRADLLILNSDPLKDLAALRDIAIVVKGGTKYSNGSAFPQAKAAAS
jgi:hypothetical protein